MEKQVEHGEVYIPGIRRLYNAMEGRPLKSTNRNDKIFVRDNTYL